MPRDGSIFHKEPLAKTSETLKEDPCFPISVVSRLIINQDKLIRNDPQFETKDGSELEKQSCREIKESMWVGSSR